MGDLVLKGATSGQITLTPTGVAGTNTLTLPARTGNIITSADTGTVTQAMLASNVAGNGPAFSAYNSSVTSIPNTTWTKVDLQTEEFDTNSNFASSRFTPTVAGYYQISASAQIASTGFIGLSIYKNTSAVSQSCGNGVAGSFNAGTSTCAIVYLNGSTDYVELRIYQATGGAVNTVNNANATNMSGALVRAG